MRDVNEIRARKNRRARQMHGADEMGASAGLTAELELMLADLKQAHRAVRAIIAQRDAAVARETALREQVEKIRAWANYSPTGRHAPAEVWPGLAEILAAVPSSGAVTSGETPEKADRCSHCGHQVHGPMCFNMASDNDCNCKIDSRPVPAEQPEMTKPTMNAAMTWHHGPASRSSAGPTRAHEIVQWCRANGGEARYVPAFRPGVDTSGYLWPTIVITGPDGDVVMHPGDTAVTGDDWFDVGVPGTYSGEVYARRSLREFSVRPGSREVTE